MPNTNGTDASKLPTGSEHDSSTSEITKATPVNG